MLSKGAFEQTSPNCNWHAPGSVTILCQEASALLAYLSPAGILHSWSGSGFASNRSSLLRDG